MTQVDNALPNRLGLEIEIFGMEGIPDDVRQEHDQRITRQYWEAQAERRAATGNPAPGNVEATGPKKPKFDSKDDVKARLAAFKARKAAGELAPNSGGATPMQGIEQGQSPAPVEAPGVMVSSSSIIYGVISANQSDSHTRDLLFMVRQELSSVPQEHNSVHRLPLWTHMPIINNNHRHLAFPRHPHLRSRPTHSPAMDLQMAAIQANHHINLRSKAHHHSNKAHTSLHQCHSCLPMGTWRDPQVYPKDPLSVHPKSTQLCFNRCTKDKPRLLQLCKLLPPRLPLLMI